MLPEIGHQIAMTGPGLPGAWGGGAGGDYSDRDTVLVNFNIKNAESFLLRNTKQTWSAGTPSLEREKNV